MYLGKKILVKPLAGQMEQVSNALTITFLELGLAMNRLNRFMVHDRAFRMRQINVDP
jgi:hypothetical protein